MPFLPAAGGAQNRRRARAVERGAVGVLPVPYPHVFPPWFHLLFLAAFAGTGACCWGRAHGPPGARLRRRAGQLRDGLRRPAAPSRAPHRRRPGGRPRPVTPRDPGGRVHPGRAVVIRQRLSCPRAAPDRLARSLILARVSGGVGVAALLVNVAEAIAAGPMPGPGLEWLRPGGAGGLLRC